jgi:hypothetical protein
MNMDKKHKGNEMSLRAAFFAAKQSPDKLRLLRREVRPPRTCTCGTGAGNDIKKSALRLWLARLLIAVVVAWNLQCALIFLLNPGAYAPGFELFGIPGETAMRGFAVLFIMWNIPYLVALWQPRRHRLSLWEALVMQTVGVIGESLILIFLPSGHGVLHGSLLRFIFFDAAGMGLLGIAIFVSRK